jgi:hypothetical protein
VALVRKHSAYLDDDVRKAFPDDDSVNEALRVIIKAAENLASRPRAGANKKRRTANYADKTSCRVIVKSGRNTLYETPTRQSRRELRNRIINNQRRLLQLKHPELKTMRHVRYILQWREDGRWVNDEN